MKTNNQTYPSAPSNVYTRSDGEYLVSKDEQLKRQKRIRKFTYIGIFLVFQIIVMTVLGLTVMKVKTPKVRLGNITFKDFNSATSPPSFDTDFVVQILVKNTNWGPYDFNAGMVAFMYEGELIGAGQIRNRKAGMRSTKKLDVSVSVTSNFLKNTTRLGGEMNSGVVTLTTRVELDGKVTLMLMMKKKKSGYMDCALTFDLAAKSVKSLEYK